MLIVTLRTRRTSVSAMGGTGGARSGVAVRAAAADVVLAAGVVTVDMFARGTGTAIGMVSGGIFSRATVGHTCAGLAGAILTCYLLIAGDGLAAC